MDNESRDILRLLQRLEGLIDKRIQSTEAILKQVSDTPIKFNDRSPNKAKLAYHLNPEPRKIGA